MTVLRFDVFRGEAPSVHPTKLANGLGTRLINARLQADHLEPLRAPKLDTSAFALGAKSIFTDPRVGYWYASTQATNFVPPIIANDPYRRAYWTDATGAKYIDTADGATQKPFVTGYDLGVPAPAVAPTTAVSGTASANAVIEQRYYVYTLVDVYGQEGPPSPISSLTSVANDGSQTVTLTFSSNDAAVHPKIQKRRIYRTAGSTAGADFMFIGETTNLAASATFIDSLPTDNLAGDVLTSTFYDPPPSGLEGLVAAPGGFLAGWKGNRLAFSEIGLPHAWPASYQQAVDYDIVGLATFGNTIAVLTKGVPYLAVGSDPQGIQLAKLDTGLPCLGRQTIVDFNGLVVYNSPYGLVAVDQGGARLITEGLIRPDQWQNGFIRDSVRYTPSAALLAWNWHGLYALWLGTANNDVLLVDPRQPQYGVAFAQLPFPVGAAFTSLDAERVFVLDSSTGDLYELDAYPEQAAIGMTWRSHEVLTDPINYAALRVTADGSVTVKYDYAVTPASSWTSMTMTAQPGEMLRLPAGFMAMKHRVEVQSTAPVYLVELATTGAEL